MEWKAQNRRKRKRKARVSRKEAAAEIESDGRRKEIADEIMRSRLSAETRFDFIGKIITKKAMRKICIAFFIGLISEPEKKNRAKSKRKALMLLIYF